MAHHVHDVTLEPENYTTPRDVTIAGWAVKEGVEAWRGDACAVPVAALTGERELDEHHHG